MADPRFYKIAFRIGHVYTHRPICQGQDLYSEPLEADPRVKSLVEEFRSTILGPMDPGDFLDAFFPGKYYGKYYGNPWKRPNDILRCYGAVPPTATYRQFIVDPLVSHCHHDIQLISSSHNLFSSLVSLRYKIKVLNKTSVWGFRPSGNIVFCDRAKLPKSKRDHMPAIVAVNERFQFVVDESKSSDKPLEIDDMGLVEYFITVQADRKDDFFHDPIPGMPFDPKKPSLHTHFVALSHIFDPEEREKAEHRLEQMIKRIVDIWNQQSRTHIFSVSIAGSMARFLRWDRSGTIVTNAFDIRQKPELLKDFQTLYYRSSREARGYDTTVSWAGRSEEHEKPEEESEGSVESEVEVANPRATT